MTDKNELSLLNIVLTISEAVDMVSPDLADHHSRVAYIVYRLADALGYSQDEKKTLTMLPVNRYIVLSVFMNRRSKNIIKGYNAI